MRTILITGAGTGIGAATARVLSKHQDIRLVLGGRRKEKLNEVKDSLPNAERHEAVAMDITSPHSIRRAFAKANIEELYGVFANAGIGGVNSYGEEDRWDEVIAVNLTGTYNTIMESLPFMRNSEEKYRNILITSSCLARFGVPHYTAYCTSKTGLLGLTRALALQLADENIRVNALCPGWVNTQMARDSIQLYADSVGMSYDDALTAQMDMVPLGKMSEPEELGKMAEFYLTNVEVSTTGQSIDVNNGSFMI